MSARLRMALLALLLAAAGAAGQQHEPANGVLLVARPELDDPNFGRSVVLVTQRGDGQTLGVILNKPTPARHEGRPLWLGGPVMMRSVVALFAADAPPPAAAFHVLKNVYLSMHPQNLAALLDAREARYYVGYVGWRPGELRREIDRGLWSVLDADREVIFRKDTEGLWEELLQQSRRIRAQTPFPPPAAHSPSTSPI